MNDRNTEVINQYDVETAGIRRGRGAWICDTDQGLKLLREYKGTVRRLEFEEQVLAYIKDQGFLYVDQYVRNREGELVSVADDGTRFMLKDWFDKRECSIKDPAEAVAAVRQIAVLHRILRQIEMREEWNLGSMIAQPPQLEMERHNREMRRARTFISRNRRKSEFELEVIKSFDTFFSQAQEAFRGMTELLKENDSPSASLCHGELNQHHILMGEGFVAIIEFNKLHLGVQMEDLYHFMRKVMEKHDWDLKLGMEMLEAYGRVTPLDAFDRQYLKYLFLYPEKYWKQINFYFNASKAWIPARNLEKLKSLGRQSLARERFIEAIK